MTIFIIHNNEAERLQYLKPKVNALVQALSPLFGSCSSEWIGPDDLYIKENMVANTWWNRLRRAMDAASLYSVLEKKSDAPNSRQRQAKLWWSQFKKMLGKNVRSITIEQEITSAHIACWKAIANKNGPAIILESDAIFAEDSIDKLVSLTRWLQENASKVTPFYIDLAGGCNTKDILNSWCFEEKFGCKPLSIKGLENVRPKLLPHLTSNTVCAYYVSNDMATKLYEWWTRDHPMMVVDWAIMLFSFREGTRQNITCIHFDPPVLQHGNKVGCY